MRVMNDFVPVLRRKIEYPIGTVNLVIQDGMGRKRYHKLFREWDFEGKK